MGKILAICFTFIVSCQLYGMTVQQYIDTYKDIAIKEMVRTGIPASITLAQGILESGFGNSMLAVKANNHFGIKCHRSWTGPRVYHDDDEKGECFRKYKSALESYIDHSDFLFNSSRYAFLFELKPSDYKGWSHGLKKAGYATARDYDKKLIDIIERYELYKYDTTGKPSATKTAKAVESTSLREVLINNNIKYILVKPGDTYSSLSYEFDMMKWQLAKYNDIKPDSELRAGSMIYLQPKRKKASLEHKFHIVKPGENMYYISQKYGVNLDELYRKNLMPRDTQPKAGETINLRKRKKGDIPESLRKELDGNDFHDSSGEMEFLFE